MLPAGAMAQSQINVTANVDEQYILLAGECEICVSDTSGVAFFGIVKEPALNFPLRGAGRYNISLSTGSSTLFEDKYEISNDTTITIHYTPVLNLEDVVVVGDNIPQTNATGQVFKLSEKAKESGDPFRALAEIPMLTVDISNQTVKTTDGDTPIVLIDGKLVNSGIQPIDPEFIESVELKEVMNAKYLELGVTKILNIKLKRNVPYYTYVDVRTRHDAPIRDGFGGANFEVGTKKFAVSGSLFGSYLHHDKVEKHIRETLEESNKDKDIDVVNGSKAFDASLMMKWEPSASEYFAATVKGRLTASDLDAQGFGKYDSSAYESLQHNEVTEGGLACGLVLRAHLQGRGHVQHLRQVQQGHLRHRRKAVRDSRERRRRGDLRLLVIL